MSSASLHVINGVRVGANAPRGSFSNVDPATGEVLCEVPLGGVDAVDAAVEAAAAAYPAWSQTPVGERCQVLFEYKQVLERNFDDLTDMIVQEHGKNVPEARGDVRRGIDCIEYACGAPSLLMGRTLPRIAVSSSFSREREENIPLDSTMERVPLGVCAGITPFNFPIMVPMWMWPMAVACGNTFVLKPSEKVPLCAIREVELAHEAGLPAGVLNVVVGGADVANRLITHTDVKAVSFVGSTPVARQVYAEATAAGKRAQCMGGAKNCMIIMPDANREAAIDGVLGSAFGNTGQRCLAGSIAIPVGDAADWFVPAIVEAARGIKTSAGTEADCGMGPLIDAGSGLRVTSAIAAGVEEGADLLLDGREATMPEGDCFVGPTVFDGVTPGMSLAETEIFGPVLSIMRRDTLDDAIEITRRSPFGNMAVMFTASGYAANRFRTEAGAGMIGINVGVPAPMAVFPFSGWKDSFFGTLHANGEDAVRFFTECRILVSRWF
ncbi:MAG: CoA-acylating methylmalonate-semialdehyde dehydrogenase [Phycisphaerales bacterium]|jgi:malonate-semialdehyde dehydrogenase (acetylating)/methylmalonate-semialdehyde dehydrogenase|nr:CoA-acylating methylmalonate-semialdehyde dehydrogenase [Phycisphaerales bacterium]